MGRLRSVAQRQPWTGVRVVLRSVGSNDDHNYDDDHIYGAANDDHRSRNDNDSGINHNYNGGRKGYYDPSRNYDDFFFNDDDDDSGSSASPAASSSSANND